MGRGDGNWGKGVYTTIDQVWGRARGSERIPGREPVRTVRHSARWARLGQEQLGDGPIKIWALRYL